MSFAISQLLLSEDKSTELTRALANTGIAAPLETCIAEAQADVTRLTTGYILDENSQNSFIRALALFKAYSLAGIVPPDVEKQYDLTLKELTEIAQGKRTNLARPESTEGSASTGNWGSAEKLSL